MGTTRFCAWWIVWLALAWVLAGCTATPTPSPTITPSLTATPNRTSTPSTTPTRTATPTWTLAPSSTSTSVPTAIPTSTPTAVPALVGTALPGAQEPIIEANLSHLRLLSQWGRGRVDGLAWSSRNQIAVGTPLGVYLFGDPAALENVTFINTVAPAGRLAFSADGRFLAVDVSPPGTGAPLNQANGQPGEAPALPPNRVQVWDLSGAEPVQVAVIEPGGLVLSIAFSAPDELALLIRQEGGAQFQRWAVTSLERRLAINLIGGETGVEAVFSKDLLLAATHGDSGPVRIWRLADGINLATTRESGELAGPMAFSPDGSLLAVGYPDRKLDYLNTNTVRVWSVPDGGPYADLRFTLSDPGQAEGNRETLVSLDWSPDGQMIAAGSEDYQVHVWKAVPSLAFRRLSGQTLPGLIRWAPDSNHLVTGGVEVWRVAELGGSNERLSIAKDFLPAVFDMTFTPDGSALVLAGHSRIDFLSRADGSRVKVLTGMQGPVNAISFDPTGELMVAACQDGTARVYLVAQGIQINNLGEPTYPMLAVDFSNDGSWVAVAGENMLIRIYRLIDGELMAGLIEPFVSYKLAFAPNTDQFASLTTSGVRLRSIDQDIEDPEVVLEGIVSGVSLSDLLYSPDSTYLALIGNNIIRVIDPFTRDDIYTLNQPAGVTPFSAAYSPDNAFLAVGWSDGYIRVYWAADGSLLRAWPAHPATVSRLAFSPDGRILASMGDEGTIRIWGLGE